MEYQYKDAHVHLLGKKIFREFELFRKNWLESGIKNIINMSSTLNESKKSLKLLEYPEIILGVGKHPWKIKSVIFDEQVEFENLISSKEFTIIGEVGLDYYAIKDEARYKFQKEWFEFFISMSNKYKKPLNVHVTGAEEDIVMLLNKNWDRQSTVNIHWYSGTIETFEKLKQLGCYFSVNPAVHYSKNHIAIVSKIPDDKLLTESDGDVFYKPITQLGEPGIIPKVVDKICVIRNTDKKEMCNIIDLNFEKYLQQ